MNKVLIDLKNISKTFDDQLVLDDLNLYMPDTQKAILMIKSNMP